MPDSETGVGSVRVTPAQGPPLSIKLIKVEKERCGNCPPTVKRVEGPQGAGPPNLPYSHIIDGSQHASTVRQQ